MTGLPRKSWHFDWNICHFDSRQYWCGCSDEYWFFGWWTSNGIPPGKSWCDKSTYSSKIGKLNRANSNYGCNSGFTKKPEKSIRGTRQTSKQGDKMFYRRRKAWWWAITYYCKFSNIITLWFNSIPDMILWQSKTRSNQFIFPIKEKLHFSSAEKYRLRLE